MERIEKRNSERGMFESSKKIEEMGFKYRRAIEFFGGIVSVLDADDYPVNIANSIEFGLKMRKVF